jgi:hypothetical protein
MTAQIQARRSHRSRLVAGAFTVVSGKEGGFLEEG